MIAVIERSVSLPAREKAATEVLPLPGGERPGGPGLVCLGVLSLLFAAAFAVGYVLSTCFGKARAKS